jgi:hypothetical protein
MTLGRCLVAQHGTRPGPEQSCPEYRLPGGVPGIDRVYASVETLPAAAAYPIAHRARINAGHRALMAGDGVGLGNQTRQACVS